MDTSLAKVFFTPSIRVPSTVLSSPSIHSHFERDHWSLLLLLLLLLLDLLSRAI